MKTNWRYVTAKAILKAIELFDESNELNPEAHDTYISYNNKKFPIARKTYLVYNKKKLPSASDLHLIYSSKKYPAKIILNLAYLLANNKLISKDYRSSLQRKVNLLSKFGFTVEYENKIIKPRLKIITKLNFDHSDGEHIKGKIDNIVGVNQEKVLIELSPNKLKKSKTEREFFRHYLILVYEAMLILKYAVRRFFTSL